MRATRPEIRAESSGSGLGSGESSGSGLGSAESSGSGLGSGVDNKRLG